MNNNMRLEDIELKLGDKITFFDGRSDFINSYEIDRKNTLEDMYSDDKLKKITKIERYETFNDKLGKPAGDCFKEAYYILKTVWEKEKYTNDDIEELDYKEGICIGEFTLEYTESEEKIIDKLNEIIRKINKIERVNK